MKTLLLSIILPLYVLGSANVWGSLRPRRDEEVMFCTDSNLIECPQIISSKAKKAKGMRHHRRLPHNQHQKRQVHASLRHQRPRKMKAKAGGKKVYICHRNDGVLDQGPETMCIKENKIDRNNLHEEDYCGPCTGPNAGVCATDAKVIGYDDLATLNGDIATLKETNKEFGYIFRICPETTFDMTGVSLTFNDMYNTILQCGAIGDPQDNCILSGGGEQIKTNGGNMLIKGITFQGWTAKTYAFKANRNDGEEGGRYKVRFEDDIWRDTILEGNTYAYGIALANYSVPNRDFIIDFELDTVLVRNTYSQAGYLLHNYDGTTSVKNAIVDGSGFQHGFSGGRGGGSFKRICFTNQQQPPVAPCNGNLYVNMPEDLFKEKDNFVDQTVDDAGCTSGLYCGKGERLQSWDHEIEDYYCAETGSELDQCIASIPFFE